MSRRKNSLSHMALISVERNLVHDMASGGTERQFLIECVDRYFISTLSRDGNYVYFDDTKRKTTLDIFSSEIELIYMLPEKP